MRYVFDKQVTADIQFLNVIPLEDSFCQIVLREDGFRSDNTRIDPRLNYSPYKGVVMAYHGVPMHSDNRIHSGTLCHFDVVDRQLGDADYQLLRQAAHMLPAYVLGRI